METEEKKTLRLTRRETEVMRLVAQGLSSKDVAKQLFIEKRSVDFHLQNVYRKTEVVGSRNNKLKALNAVRDLL